MRNKHVNRGTRYREYALSMLFDAQLRRRCDLGEKRADGTVCPAGLFACGVDVDCNIHNEWNAMLIMKHLPSSQ